VSESLPPRLDPHSIEEGLYRRWNDAGYFHVGSEAVTEAGRDSYVIMIPPPNVTAVLHMGHGLNNTIQDVLIRWRRMQGRATLWVPGTDHAGIATQNVVERQLSDEGLSRQDLGREAFEERVRVFAEETRGTILEQLKVIGCSCDWARTYFTLDPKLSRAVREVFVRLYEKELIYRGEYIINWCPRCLTALSNEEAEAQATSGKLWHLRYPLHESAWGAAEGAAKAGADAIGQLSDGRWYLTVSTTRPETMLGDTAVAVNPKDERYQSLVGAAVELPLTGRTIPIVADAFVDPEFGSGMVKVTPAHDPNDFEIGRRAGLDVLDVMTDDAHMSEQAPEAFEGMDRFDARNAVVEAFEAEGLLSGVDDHVHAVPTCYRCHTVVEPRLSEQWFVRMAPLAEPALEASRNGTVTFTPVRWKKVYEHWMVNIRDWCISRQLWWGHRIPVWYCDACGETVASLEDPTSCKSCGDGELRQDPDVLDTWFSSWLVPFSSFGWPEETEDLEAFYPGDTLITAPDILFFWVARMIMAGYEFMGDTPFTQVYLHGTVRDKIGRRMSKSLGNGIDPLEAADLFGADALRFTLLSAAAVGTDIYLDPDHLEASFAPGRNFANKVWNAGRFALMSLGDEPVRVLEEVEDALEVEDRWILSRFNHTAVDVTHELERFRLHEVSERLYHFVWGDFADWYLELVKPRMRGDSGEASRQAARATLVATLDGICRLLHPLMPFVTTALWDKLPWPEGANRPEELMIARWPSDQPEVDDPASEEAITQAQELVTQVRSLRKEYDVPEGKGVDVVLSSVGTVLADVLEARGEAVGRLARVDEFVVDGEHRGVGASAVLRSGTEVFMPLEGLIDLDRERSRLSEEIDRLEGQVKVVSGKLANEQFVERAPAEVVDKEREKARSFGEQLDKLRAKRDALAAD
jgi:valyl-tRNA synthetase